MSESNDPMIAALLREREGYERYGRKDRIAAVDAELKRRGYKKAEPKKDPPKQRAPRARKTAASSKPAAKG